MRNQTSGSITFETTSLASAIALELHRVQVEQTDGNELIKALSGLVPVGAEQALILSLADKGYDIVRRPATSRPSLDRGASEGSWFDD